MRQGLQYYNGPRKRGLYSFLDARRYKHTHTSATDAADMSDPELKASETLKKRDKYPFNPGGAAEGC